MLSSPEHHRPLTEREWDDAWVRSRIDAILDDAEGAVGADGVWPEHPDDHQPGLEMPRTIYMGAAGVLWGLYVLGRPRPDLAGGLDDAYRLQPDWPGASSAYWSGEAGILLAMTLIAGRDDLLDRLHGLVLDNGADPSNELLHGAPGTMVVSAELHRRTGDERWAAAWRIAADELWRRWEWHDDARCHLWTQRLSGRDAVYIGAGHGFAGCLLSLHRGAHLLDPGRWAELERRAAEGLLATAVCEEDRANWPPMPGPLERNDRIRVQWCHGAPGMISSFAPLCRDDESVSALLDAGGELIWDAGPLAGGPGLCHGTAGNGLALLALHERTGEQRWLDRARRFAVHALEQVDRARERHGAGRYSLWTGDIGVAVMAHRCAEGAAGMPTLDWV